MKLLDSGDPSARGFLSSMDVPQPSDRDDQSEQNSNYDNNQESEEALSDIVMKQG
jgi:hypothetical protein